MACLAGLVLTVMYHQCTADWVGAYIGVWITKLLIVLALMVTYHQRTTDGVGTYVGVWITNYQSYWFSIVL